ncbi:MAG: hypothetical protein AB1750_19850, partial [Chloroflexota bacterium]
SSWFWPSSSRGCGVAPPNKPNRNGYVAVKYPKRRRNMNDYAGTPEAPKKNNTVLIVAIVVVVLCCCCLAFGLAAYFGYDSLGDPLGIYGALPRLFPGV